MPRTWKAWGELEEREAARMWRDGTPLADIARHLGRTEWSVRARMSNLGVRRPPLRRAFWLQVLRRPHRISELAAQLGLSVAAVKQAKYRLRRLGYEVPAALPSRRQ